MHAGTDRDEARALDAADPLSVLREEFVGPLRADGRRVAYFAGNSLGLMPRSARAAVDAIMTQWTDLGVAGHFAGSAPWYCSDEPVSDRQASLVGARTHEVALMGSLTVDLHLLLASFHRPDGVRRKILVEPHAFPSDRYAVETRVALDGGDPRTDVITIPTADPDIVTVDEVAAVLDSHGPEIATSLIGGVNYYTGQYLDLAAITALLGSHGIVVGLDLAHAAGNVVMQLHDWNVDFAAWCTYKYLNGGPGSTGGYFVHERHGLDPATPRLAGWWGNDPDTRFDMHGQEHFVPRPGAVGWQISNPSMLAMAPVDASLAMFDQVGIDVLRERSVRLTAFLERGLRSLAGTTIVTPADPERRGCQLSLRVPGSASALEHQLAGRGVVVDARDPDIIRIAPTPMYNSFEDIVDAVEALADLLG